MLSKFVRVSSIVVVPELTGEAVSNYTIGVALADWVKVAVRVFSRGSVIDTWYV